MYVSSRQKSGRPRSNKARLGSYRKEVERPAVKVEVNPSCRVMASGYCLDHLEHHHWG